MTANQVAYWQLQEAKRHNLRGEAQTDRDLATKSERAKTQNIYDAIRGKVAEQEVSIKERKLPAEMSKLDAEIVNSYVQSGIKLADVLAKYI